MQANFGTRSMKYKPKKRCMRGSTKFCQKGSSIDGFLVVEGREDPNKYHYKRAIIDPPAKHHLNGVSQACR